MLLGGFFTVNVFIQFKHNTGCSTNNGLYRPISNLAMTYKAFGALFSAQLIRYHLFFYFKFRDRTYIVKDEIV